MKDCTRVLFGWRLGGMILLFAPILGAVTAQAAEPAVAVVQTGEPTTLYVSKLGDNTDGRTWRTAFPTIQAALDADA